MKKLPLFAVIFALAPVQAQMLPGPGGNVTAAVSACGATYSHCATFVIPQQSSTLTDFPVQLAGLSQWAVVGSGGQVLNTTTQTGGGASITVPADLIVTSDTCVTKVPFEWDRYVSATGTSGVLWAKATLSSSTTTTLRACWGASGVTTWQGDVPNTWNSAFTGVWHLPDGTTLGAKDSTGNADDGTLVNTPTATAGQIDGAANFVAASSQAITLATPQPSANPANTTPITLSAWVNIVGGVQGAIVGHATDGGPIEWRLDTDNKQAVNSQGVAAVGTSTSAVPTASWHHVAVTYDKVTLKFYLDGAADGSTSTTQGFSNDGFKALGAAAQSADFMSGKLDEIKVSNVIRTADWIATEYNNQHAPASWYTATVVQ